MLPIEPLTYHDILRFAQYKVNAPSDKKLLTKSELQRYSKALEEDKGLAVLLERYPPFKGAFEKIIKRSVDYWRAQEQQQQGQNAGRLTTNVHGGVYSSARSKTQEWLHEKIKGSDLPTITESLNQLEKFIDELSLNYEEKNSATLSPEKSEIKSKKEEFGRFLESAEKARYSIRQEERVQTHVRQENLEQIKKGLKDYLHYLVAGYNRGNTYAKSLIPQLVHWAMQAQGPERFDRFEVIFSGIDEARTAYHTSGSKYVRGTDYSCMPGLYERLLDAMTPVRESTSTIKIPQTAEEKFVALMIDGMTSTDAQGATIPSELLKAAYFQQAGYRAIKTIESVAEPVADFDERKKTVYQVFQETRESDIKQWFEDLNQKNARNEALKRKLLDKSISPTEREEKIRLMPEINQLQTKLTPYMQKDAQGSLLMPYVLMKKSENAEVWEQALQDDFEKELSKEQRRPNDQPSTPYSVLYHFKECASYEVETCDEDGAVLPIKSNEEVLASLSREFFLSPSHAHLVLSVIGQNKELELSPSNPYGLQALSALSQVSVPEMVRKNLDAGQSPDESVANLALSWDKDSAEKSYCDYFSRPSRPFISLSVRDNSAIVARILADTEQGREPSCSTEVIENIEPFLTNEQFAQVMRLYPASRLNELLDWCEKEAASDRLKQYIVSNISRFISQTEVIANKSISFLESLEPYMTELQLDEFINAYATNKKEKMQQWFLSDQMSSRVKKSFLNKILQDCYEDKPLDYSDNFLAQIEPHISDEDAEVLLDKYMVQQPAEVWKLAAKKGASERLKQYVKQAEKESIQHYVNAHNNKMLCDLLNEGLIKNPMKKIAGYKSLTEASLKNTLLNDELLDLCLQKKPLLAQNLREMVGKDGTQMCMKKMLVLLKHGFKPKSHEAYALIRHLVSAQDTDRQFFETILRDQPHLKEDFSSVARLLLGLGDYDRTYEKIDYGIKILALLGALEDKGSDKETVLGKEVLSYVKNIDAARSNPYFYSRSNVTHQYLIDRSRYPIKSLIKAGANIDTKGNYYSTRCRKYIKVTPLEFLEEALQLRSNFIDTFPELRDRSWANVFTHFTSSFCERSLSYFSPQDFMKLVNECLPTEGVEKQKVLDFFVTGVAQILSSRLVGFSINEYEAFMSKFLHVLQQDVCSVTAAQFGSIQNELLNERAYNNSDKKKCHPKRLEILQYLLRNDKKDTPKLLITDEEKTSFWNKAYYKMAEQHEWGFVKELKQQGYSVLLPEHVMIQALIDGEVELVEQQQNSTPITLNVQIWSMLSDTVKEGHWGSVNLLLRQDIVNYQSSSDQKIDKLKPQKIQEFLTAAFQQNHLDIAAKVISRHIDDFQKYGAAALNSLPAQEAFICLETIEPESNRQDLARHVMVAALNKNNWELLRLLSERYPSFMKETMPITDINGVISQWRTLQAIAVENKSLEQLQYLQSLHADIHEQHLTDRENLLMLAARKGFVAGVEYLIKQGVQILPEDHSTDQGFLDKLILKKINCYQNKTLSSEQIATRSDYLKITGQILSHSKNPTTILKKPQVLIAEYLIAGGHFTEKAQELLNNPTFFPEGSMKRIPATNALYQAYAHDNLALINQMLDKGFCIQDDKTNNYNRFDKLLEKTLRNSEYERFLEHIIDKNIHLLQSKYSTTFEHIGLMKRIIKWAGQKQNTWLGPSIFSRQKPKAEKKCRQIGLKVIDKMTLSQASALCDDKNFLEHLINNSGYQELLALMIKVGPRSMKPSARHKISRRYKELFKSSLLNESLSLKDKASLCCMGMMLRLESKKSPLMKRELLKEIILSSENDKDFVSLIQQDCQREQELEQSFILRVLHFIGWYKLVPPRVYLNTDQRLLCLAIESGKKDIVETLLNNGGCVTKKDEGTQYPWEIAQKKSQEQPDNPAFQEIFKLIQEQPGCPKMALPEKATGSEDNKGASTNNVCSAAKKDAPRSDKVPSARTLYCDDKKKSNSKGKSAA